MDELENNEEFMERFHSLPFVGANSDFVWKSIKRINGLAKSSGIHASGVIPCQTPVYDTMPCRYDKEKGYVTEWDMRLSEQMQFIKLDMLGLKTLDMLDDLEAKFGINPYNIPFDDNETFELLRNGDTVGVFQMSSKGFIDILKSLEPTEFRDLATMVALYRPAMLDSSIDGKPLANCLCDRKNGRDRINYLFPEEENYLGETYGLSLYQEQTMQRVRQMTGCSFGKADKVRKAVGKKDMALLEEQIDWLRKEAMDYRFTESPAWDDVQWRMEVIEQVCSDIKAGGRYCFNGKEKLMFSNNGNGFHPTIEEMYLIKNVRSYAKATGHEGLNYKYNRFGYPNTLSLTDDGRVVQNKILDIVPTGFHQTYKITLDNGATISLTENHKCITKDGTKKVKELLIGDEMPCKGERVKREYRYLLTDKGCSDNMPSKGECGFRKQEGCATSIFKTFREDRRGSSCDICGSTHRRMEVHHKDGDHSNNDTNNLMYVCPSCHKKEHYKLGRVKRGENGYNVEWHKIVSIEEDEFTMTYDVTASGEVSHTVTNSNKIIVKQCFNKSHAYAYGGVAYETAYYKAHHLAYFYVALLNTLQSHPDQMSMIIKDAESHGIKIVAPQINYSTDEWTVIDDSTISFGFSYVKGVNKASEFILGDREKNGKYTSIEEFALRLPTGEVNKSVIKNLAMAGAFDEIYPNRCTLVASIDNLCKMRTNRQKTLKRKSGNYTPTVEENLELLRKRDKKVNYETIETKEDSTEKAFMEFEVLQYFISNHPLDEYKEEIERYNATDCPLDDLDGEFYFCGVIDKVHEITTKKGQKMAFVTIFSEKNVHEFTFFPDLYKDSISHIFKGNVVVVKGNVSFYNDNKTLQGNYIRTIKNKGIRDIKECYFYPSNDDDILSWFTIKENVITGGGTEFFIRVKNCNLKMNEKIVLDETFVNVLECYGTIKYHDS